MTITAILIDARNFDAVAPALIEKIKASKLVGFDTETQDSGRHQGLNEFMKVNADGEKAGNRPLVFDVRRTVICGFSLYPDQDDRAYYVNLNHADRANRLPWSKARALLDALPAGACFVAHNAMFERVMMRNSLGYELPTTICTMQMAVSSYSPDEYEPSDFQGLAITPLMGIVEEAVRHFQAYDPKGGLTGPQGELFSKFCGKESDAAHSYNGWVKTISRPYDLKRCIEYWFGVKMQTFKETLGDDVHMGQKTGEEVVAYGADDAYWAVKLYHRLVQFMAVHNKAALPAFFKQELPCVDYYADVWSKGLRIDRQAVVDRRILERSHYAAILRRMKAVIRLLLPFPDNLHAGLMKFDSKWYANGAARYRVQLRNWANTPDKTDDFEEAQLVRGAVSISWAAERGRPEPKTLSIAHYMPARTMLYDLMQQPCLIEKGKVQSDGECRGKLKDRLEEQLAANKAKRAALPENPTDMSEADALMFEDARLTASLALLACMGELAGNEQRAKLYLNPYTQLIDPETERVYPVISSKLASRRTSIQHPNGQQLAKRGDSTYIRGFYLPDHDDHVILSCDWSSIELVLVGELSGDPEFKKAFGQLPYQDLHLGATASCLNVVWDFVNEDYLKNLKSMDPKDIDPRILTNIKGERMDPAKALKYWRTEVGKAANFGYWYSGALSDVGRRLGWTSDQMWAAVEAYRSRFAVAEQWRVDTIHFAQANGFIQLPDGHRRTRYECTENWLQAFMAKFHQFDNSPGVFNFFNAAARKIQTRANNQCVNSLIQGSCATMMKRSILRMLDAIKAKGWTDREARLLIPIHDESLVSVHKDLVVEAIDLVREAMCFPDIVTNLPLTVAPAIGRTFEPFIKGNRRTQIELAELSPLDCFDESRWGQEANDDEVRAVVDWIFERNAA